MKLNLPILIALVASVQAVAFPEPLRIKADADSWDPHRLNTKESERRGVYYPPGGDKDPLSFVGGAAGPGVHVHPRIDSESSCVEDVAERVGVERRAPVRGHGGRDLSGSAVHRRGRHRFRGGRKSRADTEEEERSHMLEEESLDVIEKRATGRPMSDDVPLRWYDFDVRDVETRQPSRVGGDGTGASSVLLTTPADREE